ncbi:hypothetical protein [Aeromonas veronii]|uniref:hypothetical protein n=1 Tax=Aeromonas veronii TaxID=654 RepID=UPI001F1BAE13|nr:hypothetical protein [Aeromonas veronii]MCF7742723.1 hypothetical protein [Aeromonas veronii]
MSNFYEVLKQPVMAEPTETERKIKNNLIAFSFISVFLHYGGLSISGESTILGLRFDGLTQDKIYLCFFMLVGYSTIHYMWYVRDGFLNWKLRLTAIQEIKAPSPSMTPFDSIDELDDKRNNTLYHWWAYQYKAFSNRRILNDALLNSIGSLEDIVSNDINLGFVDNVDFLRHELLAVINTGDDLIKKTEEIYKLLNSPMFNNVLPNFNSSFRNFLISQNLRWLVFECVIPFGLSALSLYCLFPTVFQYLSS